MSGSKLDRASNKWAFDGAFYWWVRICNNFSKSIFVLQPDVKTWLQFRGDESLLEMFHVWEMRAQVFKAHLCRLRVYMNLNICFASVKVSTEALLKGHMSEPLQVNTETQLCKDALEGAFRH